MEADYPYALSRDGGTAASAENLLRAVAGGYWELIERLPTVTRLLWLNPFSTLHVSPQVEALTGYPPGRWIDDPHLWLQTVHDDDRERVLALTAEHLAQGTPISEEYRIWALDGRVVWIREESRIIPDESGHPVASQSILLDVTERKRLEQGLKDNVELRRAFVDRLVKAEENERARVAAEIYDGPIQFLSELKLRLYLFIQRLADEQKAAELTEVAEAMDRTTHRLGLVVSELRPAMQDISGLTSEVRFMLRELVEYEEIVTHLDERVSDELTPETCRIVYRIVNESLTNIRKHARARNVVVAMESSEGGILVTVEDNGTGFDVAGIDRDPVNHIGLLLMRERAEAAGGRFRVDSTIGEGTTIEFWIPSIPVNES
jgi:PAS domain S-box-containing protein